MSLKYVVLIATTALVCVLGDDRPPARFYLTTPSKPTERTELLNDFSGINVTFETIVIAHGWVSHPQIFYYDEIAREYHAKGNYNVILVDWRKYSSNLYHHSIAKMEIPGNYIGEMLLRLEKEIGLDLKRVHLISNSLGVHMLGCTGRRVAREGHPVGRITGLDPSVLKLPAMDETRYQLRSSDAVSVVVLHTDGTGMGTKEPMGTIDFYANCGVAIQPPCRFNTVFDYLNVNRYVCSHKISTRYFIESIRSNRFVGRKCSKACKHDTCNGSSEDLVIFGADTPASSRGIYYFSTNDKKPYAMGNTDL